MKAANSLLSRVVRPSVADRFLEGPPPGPLKYFAIIPAMFAGAYPGLESLNVMGLHSTTSAVTSAIIFNAVIIVALIPLALRGVRYTPASAHDLLRRNLLLYWLGGLVLPFVGIKLIDLLISRVPGLG